MALFRCGGGGTIKRTTIWTNNAPTSSFALQTVNLTSGLSNYDYVMVKYRCSTSNSTTWESGMVKVSDFSASGGSSYPLSRPLWIGTKTNSSDNYSRAVNYDSNTSIQFSGCVKFAATTTANTYCIPLEIIGVKIT